MDLFLCFGKVASADVARQNEGADILARGGGLGRQVAAINDTTPAFCLNSPGWMTPGPELIAAMDTRNALRLLCRDRLEALVPGFAPRVREFCTAYLDAIADRVGAAEEDAANLSIPGDRFFAALLPLPCPKLAAPETASGWVEADFAFWDGEALTLIRFGNETSLLPRQRSEFTRLTEAHKGHLNMLWLPLNAGPVSLPPSILARAEQTPLPIFGPYRAPAFQAPLPDEPTEL